MNSGNSIESLPGGVSCETWIERDAHGNEIVVKQPLPRLKVVADWRASVERYAVEVRAMQVARELLGDDIVPRVLWVDDSQHRFAMERIPARFRNWKTELLSGQVDVRTASQVGALLGRMHRQTSHSEDLARAFANRSYFEELRIEPFFTRIAQRNPDLRKEIEAVIAVLREEHTALVHGDFSPKNFLVDGAEVVILDWEVAHYGNPRFDVAFCLSHLLLKAERRAAPRDGLIECVRAMIAAYRDSGDAATLDAMLARMTGCLMLARLEGDSPVNYLADMDLVWVKGVATRLILGEVSDVAGLD